MEILFGGNFLSFHRTGWGDSSFMVSVKALTSLLEEYLPNEAAHSTGLHIGLTPFHKSGSIAETHRSSDIRVDLTSMMGALSPKSASEIGIYEATPAGGNLSVMCTGPSIELTGSFYHPEAWKILQCVKVFQG